MVAKKQEEESEKEKPSTEIEKNTEGDISDDVKLALTIAKAMVQLRLDDEKEILINSRQADDLQAYKYGAMYYCELQCKQACVLVNYLPVCS